MQKKIIITGGHLTPALAVIENLQPKEWQIIFVARKYALEGDISVSQEYQIINKLRIPFISLTTGRLQRSLTRYTLLSLLKIPIGFFQSLFFLSKFKPDIILSFGGYVALPVCLAGRLLRIPIVTHEQSVIPGLANKIIFKLAKKVCLSWPKTMEKKSEKYVLTGNPIRKEIFNFQFSIFNKIPIFQFLNRKDPLIYITGGNTGARVINKTVLEILPKLLEKYQVVHQCGEGDYEKVKTQNSKLKNTTKNSKLFKRYHLVAYLSSDKAGEILRRADIVISRAGANTVTELAFLGKPAILIPLNWGQQKEQLENARLLEKAGTAIILPQDQLTGETLYQCFKTIIQNLEKYQKNVDKAMILVNPKAGEEIVKVLKETIHG